MGKESRTHVGFDELNPLEQRIEALEQFARFVNDKIDFVMQIATAQVMPAGSALSLEPPKPITIPLAELYIRVRKEGLGLQRHTEPPPQQSALVTP